MGNWRRYTMLGQSQAILEVLIEAQFVSAMDHRVLLRGESGVGKGILGQLLHENSPRRQRPMLSLDCAGADPARLETELFGLLEKAHGSTLLLAEVDEMEPRLQSLLLRFLETGEVPPGGSGRGNDLIDVRIVSATNRDLLERASGHAFSVDLYYRLNVLHLHIPPLRERREDISFLMEHYLETLSDELRLPLCKLEPSAMSTLEAYSWPGNIRELREVAELLAPAYGGNVVAVDQLPETVLRQRGPTLPIEAPAGLRACDPRLQALRATPDNAFRATPPPQRKAV